MDQFDVIANQPIVIDNVRVVSDTSKILAMRGHCIESCIYKTWVESQD